MTRARRITSRRNWRQPAAKGARQTPRISGALALALIAQATGAAMAQEAAWEQRRLEAKGATEADTCRTARAAAADEARAHLGLNIKACTCRRAAGDDEEDRYACRLDFEVLVRK